MISFSEPVGDQSTLRSEMLNMNHGDVIVPVRNAVNPSPRSWASALEQPKTLVYIVESGAKTKHHDQPRLTRQFAEETTATVPRNFPTKGLRDELIKHSTT
jgi:hypothetical protein